MLLSEIASDDLLEQQMLEAPMLEMANLAPGTTGLSVVIWMGEVVGQHGLRIKVSNIKGKFSSTSNFVVSVDKEPRVLTPKSCKLSTSDTEDVLDWIKLNYDELMELWNHFESGEGNTVEYLSKLKKI